MRSEADFTEYEPTQTARAAAWRGASVSDAGERADDRGDPVADGQKTARRPLAVYRRKSLRSSTGRAPHCALRDGGLLELNCSQASLNETTGSTWTMFRGRRPTPPSLQRAFQGFSQCMGFLEVGGVKPLRAPAVDQYRLPARRVRGITRGRRCRQRCGPCSCVASAVCAYPPLRQ